MTAEIIGGLMAIVGAYLIGSNAQNPVAVLGLSLVLMGMLLFL